MNLAAIEKIGSAISIAYSLVPAALTAVRSVEAELTAAGLGNQKMAIVQGSMEQAFAKIEQTVVQFTDIWPILKSAFSAIATIQGIFKTNASPAPVTV